MEQELVVALLLVKYKKKNSNVEVPKSFDLLPIEDKIMLLKKALKEKITLDKLV